MGNDALSQCSNCSKPKNLPARDSLAVISRQFGNTTCQILQGDIYAKGQNLVNCSYEPVESTIVKMDPNLKRKQRDELKAMKVGDVILFERQNQYIFHAKLPMYSEVKDLQKVYQTYEKCLQIADNNKIPSIAFTEQNALNFTIPKQYNAECLIRCITNYIQSNTTNLKQINFISFDYTTIQIFKHELENITEELKLPDLAEKNRKTFLEFLTSTFIEESPYQLSNGLTSSIIHIEKSGN